MKIDAQKVALTPEQENTMLKAEVEVYKKHIAQQAATIDKMRGALEWYANFHKDKRGSQIRALEALCNQSPSTKE